MISDGLLDEDEFSHLVSAAFLAPPLGDAGAAQAAIDDYPYLRSRPGAVGVIERFDGRVAGFAYGYPDFRWQDHTSDWDELLGTSLEHPDDLVGAFTVALIAVHPDDQGQGVGGALLDRLVAPHEAAWLATRDAATPAQGLFASRGWFEIGRGPLAGPGEVGAVLFFERATEASDSA